MKIIYIAPSFIPSKSANSVHVMKMCQAIAKQGHDVHLITCGVENGDINDFDYYGVRPSFKISKFIISEANFFRSIFFTFFICKKIFELKPELIYSRHRFSLILTKYFSISQIFEDHAPPFKCYQKYIINSAIKNNITKIVLISNALKKSYEIAVPSINRIKVIVAHDGADPISDKKSNMTTPPLFYNNKVNCGYIGHLYKGRGIDIIIDIADKLPRVIFHIVGGNNKDVDNWSLKTNQENVIFHGYKSNSEIPYIISQFDILLAPYQKKVFLANNTNTSQFMSPLKIFEYMSSGKPIIASNLPVLSEILINNVNAIMVEPDNVGEWIKAIKKINSNKNMALKFAENAKLEFFKKYKWETRAVNILK